MYPPENIPASQKDRKWIARYAAAFLADAKAKGLFAFQSWGSSDTRAPLTLDILNQYAEGRQSPDRTKRYTRDPVVGAAGGPLGEYNLAPGILSVAPAFESQFCSVMASQSVVMNVSTYAVQPDGSLSAPEQAAQKGVSVLRNAEWMEKDANLRGSDLMRDQVPELAGEPFPVDEGHLRYQVRQRVKEADPVKLQGELNQGFDKMGLIQTLEEIGRNFFRQNGGGIYVPMMKPHTPRYVAPKTLVALPSAYPDFRDARAMGHYEELTIGELKQQIRACDERASKPGRDKAKKDKEKTPEPVSTMPTEEEWRDLASATNWREGGPETLTRGSDGTYSTQWPYDSHRVRVLRFYFKSTNQISAVKSKDAAGNVTVKYRARKAERAAAGRGEAEVLEAPESWVYTGLLVPDRMLSNTDQPMAFACEKACDQLRDPRMPGEAILPYAVERVPGPSLLEQMVPVLDEYQYAYQRMKEDLRRALPANIVVDTAGMSTVMLQGGAEGKAIDAQDLIAAYLKTGVGMYNSDPDPDAPDESKTRRPNPFAYNGADIPPTVTGYLNVIAWCGQELSRITGLNAVTLGLAPEQRERQGKAVTEQAISASNRSLGPWLRASARMFKGGAYRLLLALAGDKSLTRAFDLRVDVGDNEQAWQQLYADARQALAEKTIEMADLFAIRRMADLLEAEDYLANKAKVARQQQAEQGAQQSQQNADVQTQAAQAKAQADQQTGAALHEMRMVELAFERETKLLDTDARETAATRRTGLQVQGAVDQQTEQMLDAAEERQAQRIVDFAQKQIDQRHERDLAAQQQVADAAMARQPTAEPAGALA